VHTVDALLDYYFEYCNWVYRHVNQAAFLLAWQKFKTGHSSSRLTLATAALSALVIRYLPPGHGLLDPLPTAVQSESSYDELSTQYYNTMKLALQRYKDENNPYTLEFVELQLVRCHYLTFTKTGPEEVWSVRGELMTVGTAMGLHQDPRRNRYTREIWQREGGGPGGISYCLKGWSVGFRHAHIFAHFYPILKMASVYVWSTPRHRIPSLQHTVAILLPIRTRQDRTIVLSEYRPVPPRLHSRRDNGKCGFITPGRVRVLQTQRPVARRMARDSTPGDRPRLPGSLASIAIPRHE
jgi:hypothetical protein